ncbi:MAG: hypothetical protein IJU23_13240 [Proteobacteria bacterium]|nr:hypothetical protein [Pseudomonadota bacterium]
MKKSIIYITLMIAALTFGCATAKSDNTGSWSAWPLQTELNPNLQTIVDNISSGKLQEAENMLTPDICSAEPTAAFLKAEIEALRANIPQAIKLYAQFVMANPDSSLSTVAITRMNHLSSSTNEPLDWELISSLRTSDPYAATQLIALQNKAMRGAYNAPDLQHPTALPLVKWHWMGPFVSHVYTGMDELLPFDNDPILASSYELNGKRFDQYQYPPENTTAMAATIQGVYVAETQIHNDAERTVQLSVQGAQFYSITVDGIQVLSRTPSEFGKENLISSRFQLGAGDHVIRLRLGLSPVSGSVRQISLWLSGVGTEKESAQQALAGLSELDDISGVNSEENRVKNIERIDITNVFGIDDSVLPGDELKLWLASMVAVPAGNTTQANHLMQITKGKDTPVSRFWSTLLYRKDLDIDASVRTENSLYEFREISKLAPQLALSHTILIREYIKHDQPKKALEIWEKYKNEFPDNADTAKLISDLSKSLGWTELSQQYTLKAAELAPLSCKLNASALSILRQSNQYIAYDALSSELQQCPQIIEQYAEHEGNDPSETVVDVDNITSSHSRTRWTDAVLNLASRYPVESSIKAEAANLLAESSPQQATDIMLDAMNDSNVVFNPLPGESAILEMIDRLRANGDEENADRILNRALEKYPVIQPFQYLKLQQTYTKPFEDLRLDGIQIIKDYLAANRIDPGSSVMILDYAATRIYPDGTRIGLTHQISRVLSKEGKIEVGEIYLPKTAALLKVRTIKDGTFEIVEPESIDFKDSITAPNLEVGDYVEIEYLTFDPKMSSVSSRAFTDMFFYGSDQSPLVRSEFVYEYPKDWDIETIIYDPYYLIQKTCEPHGDYIRCRATRKDITVYLPEPHMVSMMDKIPNLQITHLYDWEFVRKGLNETITRKTRPTQYIEAFYAGIEPEVNKADSVREKARIIYDYVLDHIDESESAISTDSETATSTVTRNTGSRVLVLYALYKLADIPAYFALVNTTRSPLNSTIQPTIYDNSHVTMLVVDTESGPAYIQPDEDFMPFDYLLPECQNQQAIPVDLTRDIFTTRISEPESMQSIIDIEYQIDDDGSASAKSQEIVKATRSVIMRNFLFTLKNDKERTEQIIQSNLANSYGRINLTDLSYERLEERNEPLVLNYSFDIASFADISDSKLNIMSRIFAYNLVNQLAPLPASERHYAEYVDTDMQSKRKLKFNAPAGFVWKTDTLHDVDVNTKYGRYTRQTHLDGNVLILEESISVKPQRVPLAEYGAFREFCLAVDEAQRIVISAVK